MAVLAAGLLLSACQASADTPAGSSTTGGAPAVETTPAVVPTQAPAPLVAPPPAVPPAAPAAGTDPRFKTCKDAKANGYGPYYQGVDPEYDWYQDADHAGIDCE